MKRHIYLYALTLSALLLGCATAVTDSTDPRIRYMESCDRVFQVSAVQLTDVDGIPTFRGNITNKSYSTQTAAWLVEFYDAQGAQVSRSLTREATVSLKSGDQKQVSICADNIAAVTFVFKIQSKGTP